MEEKIEEQRSFVKNANYYSIQGWMINELNLKGNELLIYAIIFGFSQDGKSVFSGSLGYLAGWTNSTKAGVLKALNKLVEKGLVEKIESKYMPKYRITKFNDENHKPLNKVIRPLNKVERTVKQSLTNNIDNKEIIKNKSSSVKNEIEKIEEPRLREAVENFVQMRKEIKSPITGNGLKLAMNKLNRMSNSLDEQVAILEQSTMNSWKGLFELKNDTKGGSGSEEPFKVKTIYEELNNHYKIW